MKKLLFLLLLLFCEFSCDQLIQPHLDVNLKNQQLILKNIHPNYKKYLIYKSFSQFTHNTNYKNNFPNTFNDSICIPGYDIKGQHYNHGYCKLLFYKVESGETLVENKVYITNLAYLSSYKFNFNKDDVDNNYLFYIFITKKQDKDYFVNNILNKYFNTYIKCTDGTIHLFNPSSQFNFKYLCDGSIFDFLENPDQETQFRSFAKKYGINLIKI